MLKNLVKTAEGIYRYLQHIDKNPLEIALPKHQYIPRDAESVDIRQLCEFQAAMTAPERMITLRAGRSDDFVITHYALFTDAEDASTVEFFFRLNNKRILRFHGRPNDETNPTKYVMNIGVSADVSATALIPAYIRVNPGDVLTVDGINTNPDVPEELGVRLTGYLNTVNSKKAYTIR